MTNEQGDRKFFGRFSFERKRESLFITEHQSLKPGTPHTQQLEKYQNYLTAILDIISQNPNKDQLADIAELQKDYANVMYGPFGLLTSMTAFDISDLSQPEKSVQKIRKTLEDITQALHYFSLATSIVVYGKIGNQLEFQGKQFHTGTTDFTPCSLRGESDHIRTKHWSHLRSIWKDIRRTSLDKDFLQTVREKMESDPILSQGEAAIRETILAERLARAKNKIERAVIKLAGVKNISDIAIAAYRQQREHAYAAETPNTNEEDELEGLTLVSGEELGSNQVAIHLVCAQNRRVVDSRTHSALPLSVSFTLPFPEADTLANKLITSPEFVRLLMSVFTPEKTGDSHTIYPFLEVIPNTTQVLFLDDGDETEKNQHLIKVSESPKEGCDTPILINGKFLIYMGGVVKNAIVGELPVH